MPFKNVTKAVLNEEVQELKEAYEKDPAVKEAVDTFDAEFELRLKLVEARKKAGITQKEVAESTGLAQQAISRIESTADMSPSLRTFIRYVNAIGYEIDLRPKEDNKV